MAKLMSTFSPHPGWRQRRSLTIRSLIQARRIPSATAPSCAAGSRAQSGVSPPRTVATRSASAAMAMTGGRGVSSRNSSSSPSGSRTSSAGASTSGICYASAGSVRVVSRSHPSFSSLMCSIATALAPASRSGRAWYSETQHRWTR